MGKFDPGAHAYAHAHAERDRYAIRQPDSRGLADLRLPDSEPRRVGFAECVTFLDSDDLPARHAGALTNRRRALSLALRCSAIVTI